MDTLKGEPLEQLLEASQNLPEQPQLDQETGPELEGLQYWTLDLASIMAEAQVRAKELQANLTPDQKLPAWARSVLNTPAKTMIEALRFEDEFVKNTELIDSGNIIPGEKTVTGSIDRWYRSLGPTNESDDIAFVMLGAVDTLESQRETPRRDLLMGNLIQDVALRTKSSEAKEKLLLQAVSTYLKIEKMGDSTSSRDVRAAKRYGIDCKHQLLRMQYEKGAIKADKFYEHYENLQLQSIRDLEEALANHSIGDGELLEWSSLIFLRHTFWSRENAENYDVRSALLREDQAIYPWRVEGGANPIWSYDTKLDNLEDPTQSRRIQLKAGKFNKNDPTRYRAYLPTVVRQAGSELENQRLYDLVKHATTAVKETYKSFHDPNAVMHQIDEAAIDVVSKIFERVA